MIDEVGIVDVSWTCFPRSRASFPLESGGSLQPATPEMPRSLRSDTRSSCCNARPAVQDSTKPTARSLPVVRQLVWTRAAPAAWDHLWGVVEVGGVMMVAPTVVVKSPA